MLEQRIQQQIFDSADLQNRSADILARAVADATSAVLATITSGGKVLVAGAGAGALLAPLLTRLFTGRFERERPPLAALALSPQAAQAADQVRALGLPGDVLLFLDDAERDGIAVLNAAKGKDMTVIVLAGSGAQAFDEVMADTDVLVALPHERGARVTELQLLVLHCLCDAVDYQLMGDQDS